METKRGRGRPKKLVGEYRATTLRLPAELLSKLRLVATASGQSLNDLLLELVGSWWSGRASPPRPVGLRRSAVDRLSEKRGA
jgi:hypothetical protein